MFNSDYYTLKTGPRVHSLELNFFVLLIEKVEEYKNHCL